MANVAYSFGWIYFTLFILWVLIIIALLLALSANNNIPTVTLATTTPSNISNNQTAQSYLLASAVLDGILLLLTFILILVFGVIPDVSNNTITATNAANYQFGYFSIFFYILIILIAIIVVILNIVALSYLTSTSTTVDTVSTSRGLTIGALVVNIIVFIVLLCIYFFGIRSYDNYITSLYMSPQNVPLQNVVAQTPVDLIHLSEWARDLQM